MTTEKSNTLNNDEQTIHVQRFDTYSRILHIMVITSFLTLSVTGMVIKFSGVGVFQTISSILGGYEVTGSLHRLAAIVTFAYFILHISYLIRKKQKGHSLKYMFSGEDSLVPNKRDITEFFQTLKWFLGMGPRPVTEDGLTGKSLITLLFFGVFS